jgi:hypothetical protein
MVDWISNSMGAQGRMSQKLVKDRSGRYVWVDSRKAPAAPPRAVDAPVCGEALGCVGTQVDELRADAKTAGFSDIEFREDPDVQGWYNAYAPNQRSWDRYAKHCGLPNQERKRAAAITADELASATEAVRRRYPAKEARS